MALTTTMGTATLSLDGRWWAVEAQPHVLMRLKRVFGRANKHDHGVVRLEATPENSRDLEWFAARYPLEVRSHLPDGSLRTGEAPLAHLARVHDRRRRAARAVLSGSYTPPGAGLAKPPRPYQALAAALCRTAGGLLVADELGLGKTVTALTLLAYPDALPALVAVPAHLAAQWRAKLAEFLPQLLAHVVRSTSAYDLVEACGGRHPDVVICTYTKLSGWAEHLHGLVRTLVLDEVQDLRHGTASAKGSAAAHLAKGCAYRMGLSATPIYNYGGEYWNVLEVIQPGALGGIDEFVREWCSRVGGMGGTQKWALADPQAFGTYLRDAGLMVRRTRKEVGRELPDLTQVVETVTSERRALARVESDAVRLAEVILHGSKGIEVMQASSELSNSLRQATGIDKAPAVAAFVDMLLEQSGEPVLLFGWHREVYTIWLEALKRWRPLLYTGTESPAAKRKAVDAFTSGESPLLIMSLRSGSGVDGLQQVCARVVLGELDWSPGVLEQCVGRVHRDGQDEPVLAYYLVSDEGADPVMVDVLGLKRAQLRGVNDPEGEVSEPRQVDPDHVKRLAEAYLARRGHAVEAHA